MNDSGTILFKDFLENLQYGAMLIMDENGKILKTSAGIKKSYGYSEEDLRNQNFSVLFSEKDKAEKLPETEIATVKSKGASTDHNYIMHKNGTCIWSYGETTLVTGQNGRPYFIKIIYDINNQKSLEKSLVETNSRLTRLINDLDTFVYTASHDLKAPISNIHALFSNLREELKEGNYENQETLFNMIEESIEKFNKVLNDLSETGKLQSEAIEDVSEVHFIEMLQELKTSIREPIEESGAIFIEDFGEAPVIYFSRKNLRSILYNLISNAIKYRSFSHTPEVRILTKYVNGMVLIQVDDNGIGMKDEDISRAMKMYERIHTHVEGSGVGLGIIKQIVDNAGGKIEIESKELKGSSFKIYLPKKSIQQQKKEEMNRIASGQSPTS